MTNKKDNLAQVKETISFMNLTAADCGNTYQPVRSNAESHMRVAQILAKANEYPNAIAHLILGTEEFIKALVLLMESKGFSLRKMKNYKRLFYNHKARHSIISDFFSIWMFASHLLLIPARKKNENKVLYWINLLREFSGNLLNMSGNHEWWKTADQRKQNCFYVDYENGLLVPATFTKEGYEEAKKHVNRFTKDVRILMAVLVKANDETIEMYRTTFWDTDLPDIFSETIGK